MIFILLGIVTFFCVSLFIGELAITEGRQMQLAILASFLRLFSTFTISLFVITSMVREFNDKGFELILSHPVPRSSYYFGKFAGFAIIALLITLVISCFLSFYTSFALGVFWSFSLWCELLIIISLSMLSLFSFSSITISFSIVMVFYFFSRSIEAIQLISDSPIVASNAMSHKFIDGMLELIAYLVPDLYKFTQTEWLVYPSGFENTLVIIGQTLIYIVFISSATLFDLYRKEL